MSSNNGLRVLVVEDHDDSRQVIELFLTHKGFEVSSAETGEEALSAAREERPDVILMDVSLPAMDGWEVTRRLMEDPATREIPVIAITAHAFPEHREKAESVGCRGYLTKPCKPTDILEEIVRVTRPADE